MQKIEDLEEEEKKIVAIYSIGINDLTYKTNNQDVFDGIIQSSKYFFDCT